MPNPACEVKNGGAAYVSTDGGVDITPAATVIIRLIDTSADSWSIECVYTDDTSVAATVTAALTIDTTLRTATFTAPAAGKTYIFRSRVNNGVGADGKIKSSYSTTFGVYTLTAESRRVIAANETTEGGAFGWVEPVNDMIRNPSPGGGDPSYSDADFEVYDDADPTKLVKLQCSGITTGTTRLLDVPNASGMIALLSLAQTFSARQTFTAGTSFGASPSTGGEHRYTNNEFLWWRGDGFNVQVLGVIDDVILIGNGTGADVWLNASITGFVKMSAQEVYLDALLVVLGDDVNVDPQIDWAAGAPGTSPPNGSIYLRTDGGASTGFYTRQGGAWHAVGGGNPLLDETFTWSPTSSPDTTAVSALKTGDTANATPVTLWSRTQEDESLVDYTATVLARDEEDNHFALDLRATYKRTDAGAPEVVRAPSQANPPDAGNPSGWDAEFDVSTNDVRVRFTGPASAAARASANVNVQVVTIDATPPPSWSPLDASVPVLAWYRADLGVTAPANVVSQVNDQSGAADANRNQTGTATLVPTDATYGNQATISHAAQALARVGTWTDTPAAPISVVIIGEIDSSNKGVMGDATSSNLFWSSGANWAFYDGGTLDSGVDATSPAAMLFTDDGTGGGAAAKIYVNDLSTPEATGATMFNAANGLDIGSGAGIVPNFTGKWAEIMIFDGVLTAPDIANLVTYLNTTRAYGIAVT